MSDAVLLKVRNAAKLIDCSPARLYALIARGEVPAIRLDGGVRVPVAALREMIEEKLRAQAGKGTGE
jgi:hypothetical protein